ncbi:FolM Alternative dihydrofolate reductase 1 [Aquipluma nitroreducens]|uniref:FolM Alternative dihydrofolate reductase 1 n=1 Tax=Aquipluma nitroreducens TaxID=2010828 RepID=A0A5K7S988_9BACT|nr:SDR family NAD(P)-dependent oxidoreductase [Aquipluma nitroreducens]BBE17884.1 FolM Alternative dihydrofolate reductase 1 [Aquipluma nitroreducens]
MNKTALITGAARRIGKAMAQHLASQGWNIAIHYNRSELEARQFCDELVGAYPNQQFEIFKANLNLPNEVELLIPQVIQKMQVIDLLINNASVFEPAQLGDTTTEFLDRQMNVNFKAPFILMHDFAKSFKSGVIVNFVDTRIVTNQSNFAAYSISKKALWELTKMAALEFGPDIRVNAIAPGLTLPPEEKGEDYLLKLAEKIAMKRPGGLEPILKSLDFILNNDYLTGQLLFCDGGENLGLTK